MSAFPKFFPKSAFLGPHAENAEMWIKMISDVFMDYKYWRRNYSANDQMSLSNSEKNDVAYTQWTDNLENELQQVLSELKAHFPFHSPRYLAHMLSEITLPAALGYFAGMLYNPNNVTEEAAPVTVKYEMEYGEWICEMLGYEKESSWAHICSGGTIANVEALWVARQVQFMPLVVKQFCTEHDVRYEVEINNDCLPIVDVGTGALLSLSPEASLQIMKGLLDFLCENSGGMSIEDCEKKFQQFEEKKSHYSVRRRGFHAVLDSINHEISAAEKCEKKLKPITFAPATSHYSVKKAANLLGYGEDAVRFVSVDENFRMDINDLKNKLEATISHENEYVAAVIAITGTTEEGAVDPVHKIVKLRNEIERTYGKSFWLHVDAAWGGFIRTLLKDKDSAEKSSVDISGQYIGVNGDKKTSEWGGDREVVEAFIAIKYADSVTIDPHKLGYIPYPAGVIAFRDYNTSKLMKQRANYIFDSSEEFKRFFDSNNKIVAAGQYIIEGSRPGAAAVSCWLSAKTIPLNSTCHGEIMKISLLGVRELKHFLTKHRSDLFSKLEADVSAFDKNGISPFTFELLYGKPDTNVLCLVVVPMEWKQGKAKSIESRGMQRPDAVRNLIKINELNKQVLQKFSIKNESNESRQAPHGTKFFLSNTSLNVEQYDIASVKSILSRLNVTEEDYIKNGLVALRIVVMNPWYAINLDSISRGKKSYFEEFVNELHGSTIESMRELNGMTRKSVAKNRIDVSRKSVTKADVESDSEIERVLDSASEQDLEEPVKELHKAKKFLPKEIAALLPPIEADVVAVADAVDF